MSRRFSPEDLCDDIACKLYAGASGFCHLHDPTRNRGRPCNVPTIGNLLADLEDDQELLLMINHTDGKTWIILTDR